MEVLKDAVLVAQPQRHDRDLLDARHGHRRADVRHDLHDLPRPEGARRHARGDPGPIRPGHDPGAHGRRRRLRSRTARRAPRERLRPLHGAAHRARRPIRRRSSGNCWRAGGSSISSWPGPRCTTSSCASPATEPRRRRRPPVHKILVIANREYRAIVGTKAFLIVITLMPVLMFGGIAVQKMLEGRVGPAEKKIVVLDGTGVLFDEPGRGRRVAQRDTKSSTCTTGKQIKPRLRARSRPGGRSDRGNAVRAFRAGPPPRDRRLRGNPRRHRPHAGRAAQFAKANLYAENAAMIGGAELAPATRSTTSCASRRLQAAKIDPDAGRPRQRAGDGRAAGAGRAVAERRVQPSRARRACTRASSCPSA